MIVFKAHRKNVYRVKFLPDGQGLVTTGEDDTIRFWNLKDAQPFRTLETPPGVGLADLDLSADGRFLAFSGNHLKVWDLSSHDPIIIDEGRQVGTLHFSRTEPVLAYKFRRTWTTELCRYPEVIRKELDLRPSPDFDGQSITPGWSNEFSPCGRWFADSFRVDAVGNISNPSNRDLKYHSVINVCRTDRYVPYRQLRAKRTSLSSTTDGIRFSPDGSLLLARHGPMLAVWDIESGKELKYFRAWLNTFSDFLFAPDGTKLLTICSDKIVTTWDTQTWEKKDSHAWKIGYARTLAISPDGLRYAAGGSSGKVVIWDAE